MFAPFPEEKAYEYCLKLYNGLNDGSFCLEQVTAVSEERAGNGLMLGAAVCKDGTVLVTCSGISRRIGGLQDSGMFFVEPVVSALQIDSALKQNDSEIHLLTQKINALPAGEEKNLLASFVYQNMEFEKCDDHIRIKGKINPVIRIALVVSGVLLIVPSILTDIIGAVAIALSIMCQIFLSRKLN